MPRTPKATSLYVYKVLKGLGKKFNFLWESIISIWLNWFLEMESVLKIKNDEIDNLILGED